MTKVFTIHKLYTRMRTVCRYVYPQNTSVYGTGALYRVHHIRVTHLLFRAHRYNCGVCTVRTATTVESVPCALRRTRVPYLRSELRAPRVTAASVPRAVAARFASHVDRSPAVPSIQGRAAALSEAIAGMSAGCSSRE